MYLFNIEEGDRKILLPRKIKVYGRKMEKMAEENIEKVKLCNFTIPFPQTGRRKPLDTSVVISKENNQTCYIP